MSSRFFSWYLVTSQGFLVVCAVLVGAIILLAPFNGFRGAIIYTNQYGEGWPEFWLFLLFIPGMLYQTIKNYREARA